MALGIKVPTSSSQIKKTLNNIVSTSRKQRSAKKFKKNTKKFVIYTRHGHISPNDFTQMSLFVTNPTTECVRPAFSQIKVKSMQRPGPEAIRAQIQPSKPKRKITETTNSPNAKRTYGQLSKQLFPRRWPFSNPNQT